MRILIATDAWRPQVNGVVSTLERMTQAATELGAAFEFITPQGMWSAPLPSYPEIRLAIPPWRAIGQRIEKAKPDHIHIATEGPIGWLTRRYCLKHKRIFTTSYHTRFPEYVSARVRVPEWLTYAGLRYFHGPSAAVMAPTPTISADLTRRGFRRVRLWTRGVNHALYRPRSKRALDLPRPVFLSVGRVSVEKNLEALLDLDLPGSTVVVGDGPIRRHLERRGARGGEEDVVRARMLEHDELVGSVLKKLKDLGIADNTIVVYFSDNGWQWGEHRMRAKNKPYEESIRSPMLVYYPKLAPLPRKDSRFALNVDLAPTFAELAGAGVPITESGVSLVRVIDGTQATWRTDLLTEGWPGGHPWATVRESQWKYTEIPVTPGDPNTAFEKELYDLVNDPYELTNVASDPAHAARIAQMAARLRQLRQNWPIDSDPNGPDPDEDDE